jgi:sugar phosphate permease
MGAVEALFTSGRVVDIALALMVLEAAALWAYRRARGSTFAMADVAWNLAAGAALLLALRAALTGADWPWIALPLTAALVAHIGDFRRRFAAR